MLEFTYDAYASRVLFGSGTVGKVIAEIGRLDCHAAFLVTAPQPPEFQAILKQQLGSHLAGHFFDAAMHTPVDSTQAALEAFKACGADVIVAVGGGSSIGLSKALALRTGAPQIVLPTTYAGSEMTPIIGQTEAGRKTTQITEKVLPNTVIYDVDFTLGLPLGMSVSSGLNAIAHAVEALYAQNANPVLSLTAEEGIRLMSESLRGLAENPRDPDLRAAALKGAWLCGICLGNGGVALHHKICHVLGGSFDLPHAETHAVLLPHALGYNAPAIPEAMSILRRATQSQNPAAVLYDLAAMGGVPTALKDLGMDVSGIERAVSLTLDNPYHNPRALEREPLVEMLQAAWRGQRPAA